ncbi:MAG TPA: hypothetical protein VKO18_06405 [Terriglobia bacterium]|nr:hypothetical protein [Terriglobia bacterium]
MAEATNLTKKTRLPDTPSQIVRQRWLDLLDLSYSTRRVTQQEIEPGVHAVVVPAACRKEAKQDLVEVEMRVASSQVPGMARGVRLSLERLGEFALTLPTDYHGWMGACGRDILAGETLVTAFVDLAYLEAALLARLWDHGVLVEFGSPLSFFRRGALTDYANVYETVAAMLAEGRSLADTADLLAPEILRRLQLYANAYLQLSSIYSQSAWHIDCDNFVIKVPGSRLSLALQYWELRGDHTSGQKVLHGWRSRIEKLLLQAATGTEANFPKSFAA